MKRLVFIASIACLSLPAFSQVAGPTSSYIDAMHTTNPVCDAAVNDGIDIRTPVGTAVQAPQDGVVTSVYNDTLHGCGLTITLKHADGSTTGLAWLAGANVKAGDQVKRSEVIAFSGQSGNADSPKTHYTLFSADGKKVDPRNIAKSDAKPFTNPEDLQKAIDSVNQSNETQRVKDVAVTQLRSDYNTAREIAAQEYRQTLDRATDAWYANKKDWKKIPSDLWNKLTERDRGRFKDGIDPETIPLGAQTVSSNP